MALLENALRQAPECVPESQRTVIGSSTLLAARANRKTTSAAPLCPLIAAAVEISDPGHPARVHARNYKVAFAARLADAARDPGAADPDQLGEQLALLLDGASARSRVLDTETLASAAAIAAVLVDNAIPAAAGRART